MAPRPVLLSLLWGLALAVHGASSLCNVTCWTDYNVLLNCSCSGSVPAHPVQVQVVCRDFEVEVNVSCEVKPPQSWCTVESELETVASVDTLCNTSVKERDDGDTMKVTESSSWALSDVVKPQPPFSVRVTNAEGSYNITWDVVHMFHCLSYKVRVRESGGLSKDSPHYLEVEETFVVVKHKTLQPHVDYTIDVRAKLCERDYLKGPWSEWSRSAGWRTAGTSAESQGWNRSWWFVSLPIVLVLGLLILGYLQKPFWQRKIRVNTNVPQPNDFFKPLYHSYGGNFKEWVKPVFSEYDYVKISSLAPAMSEKQHDVLHWSNEKQSYGEDGFVRTPGPHAALVLQGTGQSSGHVSIHTVTLSGEELDGEVVSRSYREGESLASYAEDGQRAGYDPGEQQLSQGLPQNHLSLENIDFNEAERVSLDEQSEDGYPHVDLDTIDSGFVECSSPGVSPSGTAEQMDSDLFQEHTSSNSNYVKQWMICSAIREDSSSESELHQTLQ